MYIDSEMAAILGIVMIPFVIIGLAVLAFVLIGNIRLFKKCGHEGWQAIIPFYSDYVFFTKICSLHWGWFVGFAVITILGINKWYIEVLRILIYAIAYYNLAQKAHRDATAAAIFGGIFGSFVGAIYGFMKDFQYDPEVEVKENGFINL